MSDESALSLTEMAPTKEEAQKLIRVIVDEASSFTANWIKSYNDLDSIFLERTFDIGGFQCSQFVKHGLRKHGVDDIDKLGTVFEELGKQEVKYLEKYPLEKRQRRTLLNQERNLPTDIFQFMEDLQNGKGGVYGQKYYQAIADFLKYENQSGRKIRKGGMMWKIIWAYCWNCRYLRENYGGSFKVMVREKAEEWLRDNGYGDEVVERFPAGLALKVNEWEDMVSQILKEIQRELKYVGRELAPYLLRDVREFSKAEKLLFKLDAINTSFVKKSGIIFLPYKEENRTLDELKKEWNEWGARKQLCLKIIQLANPGYSIQSINRNVYAYSAKPHAKNGFGYCWTEEACERCKGRDFCLSGRIGIRNALKKLEELGFI